jgi:hypothetical protein
MEHAFAYASETDSLVTFTCPNCGKSLVLNKPGVGEPSAIADGGSWTFSDELLPNTQPCEIVVTPEVPLQISKRQFLIQLLRSGMVAESEVPTLATTPPALMAPAIAGMTTEQQLELTLTWASMTVVERYGELTTAAAASAGTTEAQLDEFFIAAGAI